MMDLSLVTTRELAKELLARNDIGVIILSKEQTIDDTGDDMIYQNWKGRTLSNIGLLELVKKHILEELDYLPDLDDTDVDDPDVEDNGN